MESPATPARHPGAMPGPYWQSADGDQATIDLNGPGPGSITTSLSNLSGWTTGATYRVSFSLAANPDNTLSPQSCVRATTANHQQDYCFNVLNVDGQGTQASSANMGWQRHTFEFTGAPTDQLTFTSLDAPGDGWGPALDHITVEKLVPTTGPGVRHLFTGKERDAETNLDYFGARYMSAAQGRFTSADAPFADQNPADPQSWNLYLYVRNNPIIFVDPTGQRIELTGATEEERRKQLAAIQEAVGEEAGQRLTIHGDKKTGFYVGITGDLSKFRDINPVASAFATIITLQESAKFYLVSSMERMDMSDGNEYTLYALKATGATVRDIDGQLRVFVREPREGYPRDLPFGTSSWIGLANNLGTTVGHEFGHALEHMMGRLVGKRPTKVESNNGSLRLENMVRRLQGGPNAAIRLRH